VRRKREGARRFGGSLLPRKAASGSGQLFPAELHMPEHSQCPDGGCASGRRGASAIGAVSEAASKCLVAVMAAPQVSLVHAAARHRFLTFHQFLI
jgi:hypothetical protein